MSRVVIFSFRKEWKAQRRSLDLLLRATRANCMALAQQRAVALSLCESMNEKETGFDRSFHCGNRLREQIRENMNDVVISKWLRSRQ
jgi:hypothetical protein